MYDYQETRVNKIPMIRYWRSVQDSASRAHGLWRVFPALPEQA